MKNKEIEEYYFEMFRRDYSLPDGAVEYGDKPDVILSGARTIGIEITNFFLQDGAQPESEQIQRKARGAVVSDARGICQRLGAGKLGLTFGFDRTVPICDQSNLAQRIAELATKVESPGTGQLPRDVFEHIPELSFVYLNSTKYDDAPWRIQQLYSGVITPPHKLQEIIRGKETKSRKYSPCDAYWLLIVVDFLDAAQDQEIPADTLKDTTSQVFEKIIVYKNCFGSVVETQ